MAKPKRRRRHPDAAASHQSAAKRAGASSSSGVSQVPIHRATANGQRLVSKATSSVTESGRRASSAADTATGTATRASSAMRQRVYGRGNQRRYARRHAWWSSPMSILLVSVGGVLLIVGIFVLIAHSQNSSAGAAHSTPAALVLNAVEHPKSAIFAEVGAGTSYANLFVPLPNKSGTGLPAQNGKPVLLYIGGEFCPYCAADRWALIMALSRFGTLSGIETNSSSTVDAFPGTPTFTFVKATYTSPYLVFDPKETFGATQYTPLELLSSAESSVFDTYDAPPYVSQTQNRGIPFIDFGGLYMTSGGSYDVGVLHVNPGDLTSQALTYAQIVSGLSNASDPIAQGIVGTANKYTAAICKMTNNSDKAVCSTATISQIESQLPPR